MCVCVCVCVWVGGSYRWPSVENWVVKIYLHSLNTSFHTQDLRIESFAKKTSYFVFDYYKSDMCKIINRALPHIEAHSTVVLDHLSLWLTVEPGGLATTRRCGENCCYQ